jgi:hypothetical protein
MKAASWQKVTGWAGVLGVIISFGLGAGIASSGPNINASAEEIRTWFVDNETGVALFTWAMPLAFGVLILLFASGLRSLLAPADAGNEQIWSRLSFAGAVVQASVGLVGLSFWGVLGQADILAVMSDEMVRTLAAFDTMLFFSIMTWPTAVFLLGASVVIVQSGVLPKWIGWAGGVFALSGVIGALWIFSGDSEGFVGAAFGAVGFFGMHLWILVVAIAMIRSPSAVGEPAGA